MLVLDVLLYSLLLWYLDQTVPSEVGGQQLPWSFPLSPAYWRQLAPSWLRRRGDGDDGAAAALDAASRAEAGGAGGRGGDAAAAVRIVGLRKVYPTTDGMQKASGQRQ